MNKNASCCQKSRFWLSVRRMTFPEFVPLIQRICSLIMD